MALFSKKPKPMSAETLIKWQYMAGMYVRYLEQSVEFGQEEGHNKKERALLWLQNEGIPWEWANILVEAAVYDMKK